jgi:hypothetical protein
MGCGPTLERVRRAGKSCRVFARTQRRPLGPVRLGLYCCPVLPAGGIFRIASNDTLSGSIFRSYAKSGRRNARDAEHTLPIIGGVYG